MGKRYKDTDYLHASTRVRALENGMLGADDFRKMAEARDAVEAYKVLAESPLCQGWAMEDYEKALSKSQEEAFNLVAALVPGQDIAGLFRVKYDGHNLKTAIKAKRLKTGVEHIYSALGTVSPEKMLVQLEEGKLASYPDTLAAAAREALELMAKTGDPQMVDVLLDKAVLAEMELKAKAIASPFLTDLVNVRIDLANIRSAVRIQRMGKDAAALGRALVPGGTLDLKKLERAALEGVDDLLAVVGAWKYGDLLEPSFASLKAGESLTKFEKLCDNLLIGRLDQARTVPFGIEPVITYLYAKESEVGAARIVMASKLAGVAPGQIMERLRDTYGK